MSGGVETLSRGENNYEGIRPNVEFMRPARLWDWVYVTMGLWDYGGMVGLIAS